MARSKLRLDRSSVTIMALLMTELCKKQIDEGVGAE